MAGFHRKARPARRRSRAPLWRLRNQLLCHLSYSSILDRLRNQPLYHLSYSSILDHLHQYYLMQAELALAAPWERLCLLCLPYLPHQWLSFSPLSIGSLSYIDKMDCLILYELITSCPNMCRITLMYNCFPFLLSVNPTSFSYSLTVGYASQNPQMSLLIQPVYAENLDRVLVQPGWLLEGCLVDSGGFSRHHSCDTPPFPCGMWFWVLLVASR